jgi:hypothetical protein
MSKFNRSEKKENMLNFRITETDRKNFEKMLKQDGVKKQHWFDQVMRAYIYGMLFIEDVTPRSM